MMRETQRPSMTIISYLSSKYAYKKKKKKEERKIGNIDNTPKIVFQYLQSYISVFFARGSLLFHFSSMIVFIGTTMTIYKPCCSLCVHMSLVIQPAKW